MTQDQETVVGEDVRQIAIRMGIAAKLASEAILPLLDLDEDNKTTDTNVSLALASLATVVGSLLSQREGAAHDKLLSTFWDSVSNSIDVFRERIREIASGRGDEE